DVLSTLIYVRNSSYLESDDSRKTIDGIMERGVRFALSVEEKHGEIANHIASFAYELLNYAAAVGHDGAHKRGLSYVDRLLSLFDKNEGWFQEYEGPDPGYQTRTIRYLAKCAEL